MDLWNNILSQIKKKVSFQNFDIWFKPTALQRQDQDSKTLFVRVPNTHFKYWLAENYSEVIQASLSELNLNGFRVSFVSEDDSGEQAVNEQQGRACTGYFIVQVDVSSMDFRHIGLDLF